MLALITNIASSVSITGRSLAHRSLEVSAVSRTSLSLPALPVRLIPDFETSSPSYSLGAVGGTESLGITAGETKNPGKNMPRVVKFVFWRCACFLRKTLFAFRLIAFCSIMLFYILSILLIGLNGAHILEPPFTSFCQIFALLVPWDYPNLSNKTATTSPFTIVFKQFGSSASIISLLPILRLLYRDPPLSHRRIFHEYRHPQLCHFRR